MSRTSLAALLLVTLAVTACNSDERVASLYCETVEECGSLGLSTVDECESDTVDLLDDADNTCADVHGDLLACIGRLTCDEYDDYWEEPTEDYPCAAEDDAVVACIS